MQGYQIITTQAPEFLAAAGAMLGVRFDPTQCATITCADGDDLLAVVVFSRFASAHCEMSIASWSPHWAKRRFIAACFDYVFRQCGLCRVNAVCEADNRRSADMMERLGFIQEARLARWFGSKDGVLYRMLDNECRWSNERYKRYQNDGTDLLRAAA